MQRGIPTLKSTFKNLRKKTIAPSLDQASHCVDQQQTGNNLNVDELKAQTIQRVLSTS